MTSFHVEKCCDLVSEQEASQSAYMKQRPTVPGPEYISNYIII